MERKAKWSMVGVAFLLLWPVLLWSGAAWLSLDVSSDLSSQGDLVGVVTMMNGISAFAGRMAALSFLVMNILKLRSGPSTTTPRWMQKKVSSVDDKS